MKFAVISDIHGNIDALQTVLEDINKHDVQNIYCAGDLVGYGPNPNEVIQLIREKDIQTVLGNYDDGIAFNRLSAGVIIKMN